MRSISLLRLFLAPCAVVFMNGPAAAVDNRQSSPITIDAEEGIEWRRDERIVFARGNAKAVRGEVTVTADELSARYREREDGEPEISQIEARGTVNISSRTDTFVADQGTFDLDRNLLVLTGDTVRLTSGQAEVTATERMEYTPRSRTLVARGNAQAQEEGRQLRGDVLTIYLRDNSEGGSRLRRIEAERNVWVITPGEVMRGDRGTYDLEGGTATLTGAVKVSRGDSQLNGCKGEVDLRTGVSRLSACQGGDAQKSRVRGLIVPGAAGRD